MAAIIPGYLTMSHDGSQGDREFVFSCKGQPFSVLTALSFPTPPSTMVDYNLVRDLKLRMTDLQCAKMIYAGQKFRILGRVSTSVQCISDGAPAGNTHFKAIVVQDLYQNLDTHSIAGQKFSEKLIGPPYKLLSECSTEVAKNKLPTEPTTNKKVKKKAKSKPKRNRIPEEVSTSDSAANETTDEYNDNYTNVSTVRYFGEREATKPVTLSTIKDRMNDIVSTSTAPSAWGDWVIPAGLSVHQGVLSRQVSGPPDSFGPARARLFSDAVLARRKRVLRSGQSTPEDLRHAGVPVPHGANWCDADCPWEGEENLPPECGYHPRFGRIDNCSAQCPGGWCQHTRQMDGRDFMS